MLPIAIHATMQITFHVAMGVNVLCITGTVVAGVLNMS